MPNFFPPITVKTLEQMSRPRSLQPFLQSLQQYMAPVMPVNPGLSGFGYGDPTSGLSMLLRDIFAARQGFGSGMFRPQFGSMLFPTNPVNQFGHPLGVSIAYGGAMAAGYAPAMGVLGGPGGAWGCIDRASRQGRSPVLDMSASDILANIAPSLLPGAPATDTADKEKEALRERNKALEADNQKKTEQLQALAKERKTPSRSPGGLADLLGGGAPPAATTPPGPAAPPVAGGAPATPPSGGTPPLPPSGGTSAPTPSPISSSGSDFANRIMRGMDVRNRSLRTGSATELPIDGGLRLDFDGPDKMSPASPAPDPVPTPGPGASPPPPGPVPGPDEGAKAPTPEVDEAVAKVQTKPVAPERVTVDIGRVNMSKNFANALMEDGKIELVIGEETEETKSAAKKMVAEKTPEPKPAKPAEAPIPAADSKSSSEPAKVAAPAPTPAPEPAPESAPKTAAAPTPKSEPEPAPAAVAASKSAPAETSAVAEKDVATPAQAETVEEDTESAMADTKEEVLKKIEAGSEEVLGYFDKDENGQRIYVVNYPMLDENPNQDPNYTIAKVAAETAKSYHKLESNQVLIEARAINKQTTAVGRDPVDTVDRDQIKKPTGSFNLALDRD